VEAGGEASGNADVGLSRVSLATPKSLAAAFSRTLVISLGLEICQARCPHCLWPDLEITHTRFWSGAAALQFFS
jgi:hypothetical protein